ncbi:hypothetical protein D3C84_915960 [compost metagenome]
MGTRIRIRTSRFTPEVNAVTHVVDAHVIDADPFALSIDMDAVKIVANDDILNPPKADSERHVNELSRALVG